MKKFAVVIFEFNTGEKIPSATLWLKISTDEALKTYIPIDFEATFIPIGPLHEKIALRLADVIKEAFTQLEVEYIEHATADD